MLAVSLLLILLAAVPAAGARRACGDAYVRCQEACTQQFGGGIFSSGCVAGCSIGYVWCVASN